MLFLSFTAFRGKRKGVHSIGVYYPVPGPQPGLRLEIFIFIEWEKGSWCGISCGLVGQMQS